MDKFTFSLKNVVNGEGVGIALTGMLIVFAALGLIALFIKVLPFIMEKLSPYLPKGEMLHAHPASQPKVPAGVNESLAAAIGYALYKKQMSGK